jgi:splicing factor U2AF 65 kDa subunit
LQPPISATHRDRARERDREDRRSRFLVSEADPQALYVAQLQQQQQLAAAAALQQQQFLAAQLVGGAGAPGAPGADPTAAALDRKQREVYIGNLAIGSTTSEVLKDFFNQAMAHLVPDPVNGPPVHNINMDAQGRFAFVEFISPELAEKALVMDRVVEIYGRAMHIGRPKGYVELPPGTDKSAYALPQAKAMPPPTAQGGAATTGPPPTRVLLLSGLLSAGELRDADDREALREEVATEAAQHGAVEAVAVPAPLVDVQDRIPGRCYVLYASPVDADKGRKVFHGRTLDSNTIKAKFVPDAEWEAAAAGEWVVKHAGVAGIPLPGERTLHLYIF